MRSVRVISDFNAELLARLLTSDPSLGLEATTDGLGDMHGALLSPRPCDICFVWARAEAVFPAFAQAARLEPVPHQEVLAEIDDFADLLGQHAEKARLVAVATWSLPPDSRGYGVLDWRTGIGLANLVARMNLHLSEQLARYPNIYLLDSARWLATAGQDWGNPRMWYASKSPFSTTVLRCAIAELVRLRDAVLGKSRRLLALDLDDMLWGGVVGEEGWQGIRLGGHDLVGEAFVDFQQELKALQNAGVQLAIVSKNEEPTALQAIDLHDAMVLRRTDFAAWKINWRDKAQNIAELLAELRLTPQSTVFLDNEPVERARVRDAFPDILVPEWPEDPAQYVRALRALGCFDLPAVSDEDRARARMYAADRERREELATAPGDVSSAQDWLRRLGMVVTVSTLRPGDLARAAQLFNKTNQMNMATRRMTELELAAWAGKPNNRLWTFRVADRFGDLGLVGVASASARGSTGELVDFLMSCRTMGRGVEDVMLATVCDWAKAEGVAELRAEYVPSDRNTPCLRYLEQADATARRGNLFIWDLISAFPKLPDNLTIRGSAEAIDAELPV